MKVFVIEDLADPAYELLESQDDELRENRFTSRGAANPLTTKNS